MNQPFAPDPGPPETGPAEEVEFPLPEPPDPFEPDELNLRSQAPLNQRPAENKEDPAKLSAVERHSRKCQVCSHPDREAIEKAFIHWRKPKLISRFHRLSGGSLYRHARALNLFARRKANVRSLLENIMERGVETEITGDTMLRTIRAYVCLSDDNQWIEPTSNVVFSTRPSTDTRPPLINVTATALSDSNPRGDDTLTVTEAKGRNSNRN